MSISQKIFLVNFGLIIFCTLATATLQTLIIRTIAIGEDENSGDKENYNARVADLSTTSEIVKKSGMKTFCIMSPGLWITQLTLDHKRIHSWEWISHYLLRSCTSYTDVNGRYYQLNSIRHGGHGDHSLPALNLYTEPGFSFIEGDEFYFDGTSVSLSTVTLFKSFAFTGKDGWRVYSGQNFEGISTCLSPDRDTDGKDVTMNRSVSLVVGSIRKGCEQVEGDRIVYGENLESSKGLVSEFRSDEAVSVQVQEQPNIYAGFSKNLRIRQR